MRIDERRLSARHNNLNAVRLALAATVIWSHCYGFIHGGIDVDEFRPVIGHSLAHYAVQGFFFLSGFLVYASLQRRASVIDFAGARLARLWPGLFVCIVATVAVGALVTTASGTAYFGGDTMRFLVGNLTLTKGQYALTGVMCGDAPCTINGSLWTLPWEVRCYILLALLALIGWTRPSIMTRVVIPVSFVAALIPHLPPVADYLSGHVSAGRLYNLRIIDELWTMFVLGIAAFLWRDRIPLSWPVCAALVAIAILAGRVGTALHLDSLALGYLMLCAGFLSARRRAVSAAWPDYSYGIYIYAFPVMVALGTSFAFPSHAWLALANLIAVVPLAAASWHWVEKPWLDRVRRRRTARDAVSVDAHAVTADTPR